MVLAIARERQGGARGLFRDHRIRLALEAGEVGVWRWEMAADKVEWSPNLIAIHGLSPDAFSGGFSSFADDIHPDDRDRVMETIARVMETGGSYHVEYRLPPRPGREERWIEGRGRVEGEPGHPVAMTGICHDITGRKRLEVELAARLRQQEVVAALGALAQSGTGLAALFERSVELLAEALDVEMAKVLELTPEADRLLLRAGIGWQDGLVGRATVGIERDSQAGFTLLSKEPVVVTDLTSETRFSGPPLLRDHGVVSGMSTPIPGVDGRPFGVLGIHTRRPRTFTSYDISILSSVANILGSAVQRAHAEGLRHLLDRELRHRVGNLFAQLAAIHRQTANTCDTVEALCEKFASRLGAIADAHELISREGWTTTALGVLMSTMLRPYEERVTLEGPEVLVPAETAFALGLVISELATNAAKYGCFADGAGTLSVRWDVVSAERKLRIGWTEHSRARTQPPARKGFGSRLIEGVIGQQLHGTVERTFGNEGLRLRMVCPMEADSGAWVWGARATP